MNHEETRITLRLPNGLHAWLVARAKNNRRPLDSEIPHRIEGEYRTAAADAESP